MKSVVKYSTFEDLKSAESKPKNAKASLKRHNEFKKFIETLRVCKIVKAPSSKSAK